MKKIKYLVCLVVIMMFVSIVNVDAAGVSIKSVKLVDKIGKATELSNPVPNGLDIKFDLSFVNVGDTVKYEVVLNNPTNKEYEIDTDKQFSNSNYISYSYELKDKTNRIKANSEVTLYVIIKYEKSVPAEKLVNGQYIENNDMGINLLNEENPSTANNIIYLILILLGVIGFTFLSKNIKNKEYLIIFVALLLVPVTVFALEKLKLTVSTKITIDVESYDVYYSIGNVIKANELDSADYYDECEPLKIRYSDDSIEDYYICKYLYKKDTEKYPVGSIVNIKSVAVTDLMNSSNLHVYCSLDSDNIYICNENIINNTRADYYDFNCSINLENDNYGRKIMNKCSEEEFLKMFNNPYGWEDGYGYILGKIPGRFIMPSHDVFIHTFKMYYT